MTDSKLYHLLIALSERERERLLKYFVLELVNEEDDRYKIVYHLMRSIKNLSVSSDKQAFFKTALGKVPAGQKMNVLLSETVRLTENFIVAEAAQKDNDIRSLFLSEFYYKNKENAYFEQSLRKYEQQQQEKLSLRSFSTQIETEFLYARYLALNNNRDVDLISVRQVLEEFYATWKLKLDNITGVSWLKGEHLNDPQNPLYLTHFKIRELFKSGEELLYLEIFEEIQSSEALIEQSELRVLMMLLDNFCINQLNEGKFHFIEHTFKLYKKMIQLNVLLDNDETLLAGQYKNAITVALRTQSFDWAEWFLETYKHNIRDDQAETVYVFNKANVAFEQKQYEYCLHVLSQVVFKDVFYKLTTKRLMIKSLYMLYRSDRTYFDTLHGHLNAFKKFIYTKKNLPEVYQETNKNFYKFIHQIFFAAVKNSSETGSLKNKVQDCDVLADKNWLLQVLNMR